MTKWSALRHIFFFLHKEPELTWKISSFFIFSSMTIVLRAFSRRDLPITKQDWLALNSLDRIRLRIVQDQLLAIISAITIVNQCDCDRNERILPLLLILLFLLGQYQNILVVNISAKPPRICRLGHTFDTFMTQTIQNGSTCSEKLRFQSLEQLQRLQVGFRFLKGIIRIKGYKFTSEEIILISLTRYIIHYHGIKFS